MSNKLVSLINKNPTVSGIVVSLILAAFGVWCLVSCIGSLNTNAHLREICTAETAGTVTDYHRTGDIWDDSDGEEHDNRQDYPIYEYQAGGRTYIVQSTRPDLKGKWRYEIGAEFTLRYNPADPEQHYLPGESGYNKLNAWLGIGFGGLLSALAVFVFIRMVTKGGTPV